VPEAAHVVTRQSVGAQCKLRTPGPLDLSRSRALVNARLTYDSGEQEGRSWAEWCWGPIKEDDPEGPLENQPLEWAVEDREIEGRKPDLGETEEDTGELKTQ